MIAVSLFVAWMAWTALMLGALMWLAWSLSHEPSDRPPSAADSTGPAHEEDTMPQPDQHAITEAVANLFHTRAHVEAVYRELHAREIGGGLESGADSLGQALADLNQAIRWLTGEEVPS